MLQVTSGRMGIVSSRPIEMGHLMVYSAACALLGKPTPKYVSVDPITLNQRNVEEPVATTDTKQTEIMVK